MCPPISRKRVAGIAAEGASKLKMLSLLTSRTLDKAIPVNPFTPTDLSECANIMGNRKSYIEFFQACVEARVPPELEDLPVGSHPAAPILSHTSKHGVPINIPCGMIDTELENAIAYGTHSSTNKYKSFVRT